MGSSEIVEMAGILGMLVIAFPVSLILRALGLMA